MAAAKSIDCSRYNSLKTKCANKERGDRYRKELISFVAWLETDDYQETVALLHFPSLSVSLSRSRSHIHTHIHMYAIFECSRSSERKSTEFSFLITIVGTNLHSFTSLLC